MTLLFLCTGNSARSQMAEAIARAGAPTGAEVFSAGTHPKGIHPLTLRVLGESGFDVTGLRSKGVDEAPPNPDIVVTLCGDAAEACPVFPGAVRREHWDLSDPARAGDGDDALPTFRAVRDDIDRRVHDLWLRLENESRRA